MMLVTLEQARAHLRSDTYDDDEDLTLKIEDASEAVFDYISDNAKVGWTDSNGDPIIGSSGEVLDMPRRVRSAVLMMTAYLFKERDGSNENQVPTQWGYGYLPIGVTAILYSLRKPTVV